MTVFKILITHSSFAIQRLHFRRSKRVVRFIKKVTYFLLHSSKKKPGRFLFSLFAGIFQPIQTLHVVIAEKPRAFGDWCAWLRWIQILENVLIFFYETYHYKRDGNFLLADVYFWPIKRILGDFLKFFDMYLGIWYRHNIFQGCGTLLKKSKRSVYLLANIF